MISGKQKNIRQRPRSLGMAVAAFSSDLSLVPLAHVLGLASHWPAVGWLFETSIFTAHAIVRVVLATAIWFLLPDARFTLLAISISAVYAVTSFMILRDLRRVAEVSPRTQ